MLATSIVSSTACKKNTAPSDKPNPTAELDINTTGGTIFIVQVLSGRGDDGQKLPITDHAIASTMEAVTKRLSEICPGKFEIKHEASSSRISIELIAVPTQQVEWIKNCLETPGRVELKLVHPDNSSLMVKRMEDPRHFIIPGYTVMDFHHAYDGITEKLLIRRRSFVDSSHIILAKELYEAYEGMILIELGDAGGKIMQRATQKMKHGYDRIAIILDGKIQTAPVVQSSLGKRFQIAGFSDAEEAKAIATALTAPLSYPLRIEELRTIPPQPEN